MNINENSMPFDKRIIFVKLSNRLYWWLRNPDYPNIEFDENTTIGELLDRLDSVYTEYQEREKQSPKNSIFLGEKLQIKENSINTQNVTENAIEAKNEAEIAKKEEGDILDLCSM